MQHISLAHGLDFLVRRFKVDGHHSPEQAKPFFFIEYSTLAYASERHQRVILTRMLFLYIHPLNMAPFPAPSLDTWELHTHPSGIVMRS